MVVQLRSQRLQVGLRLLDRLSLLLLALLVSNDSQLHSLICNVDEPRAVRLLRRIYKSQVLCAPTFNILPLQVVVDLLVPTIARNRLRAVYCESGGGTLPGVYE